jgi:hypothetical protein
MSLPGIDSAATLAAAAEEEEERGARRMKRGTAADGNIIQADREVR